MPQSANVNHKSESLLPNNRKPISSSPMNIAAIIGEEPDLSFKKVRIVRFSGEDGDLVGMPGSDLI